MAKKTSSTNKIAFLVGGLLGIVGLLYFFILKENTKNVSFDTTQIASGSIQTVISAGNVSLSPSSDSKLTASIVYKGSEPEINTTSGFNLNGLGKKIKSVDIQTPQNFSAYINITAGAANMDINLQKTNIAKGFITVSAGNLNFTVPESIEGNYEINVGAGNLTILVPEKIDGLRIVPKEGTTISGFGEDFQAVDGGFETEGYASGKIRTEIKIAVGSAGIDIRNVDSN